MDRSSNAIATAEFVHRPVLQRIVCMLFGHQMENKRTRGAARTCSCGAIVLRERVGETRIRHNLSCFFLGHRYANAGTRQGIHEYVCEQCGHPLLYPAHQDPYDGLNRFQKSVSRLCGLFGHRVREAGRREGLVEYLCHCGHPFLRASRNLTRAMHPLVCVFAGHFVRFTERRGEYAEFLCRNCGHTFYLW